MSNFVPEFMIVYETMTLRELLQSVDWDDMMDLRKAKNIR